MMYGFAVLPRRSKILAAIVLLLISLTSPIWAQPWDPNPKPPSRLLVLIAPPSQGVTPEGVVRGIAEHKGLDSGFSLVNLTVPPC